MKIYPITETLFIDIETVSQFENFELVPERFKSLWQKKHKQLNLQSECNESYFERAGIYAEFGKIIVIAAGIIIEKEGEKHLRIKAFSSHNEFELLSQFAQFLNENNRIKYLCAHNGREFDFPYLCRRMLVNKIAVPHQLNISQLKPWEIPHFDTLDMWKFGDYKNYTSLETLATVFNIETSKDGIDGSMINSQYYYIKDLEKIVLYCKKDVLVLTQVFLCLIQLQPIQEKNVTVL